LRNTSGPRLHHPSLQGDHPVDTPRGTAAIWRFPTPWLIASICLQQRRWRSRIASCS
jgi:hypothetical protein